MQRRTLLQTLFALLAALAHPRLSAATPAVLPGPAEIETLGALAEVVLPSELGEAGRRAAARSFLAWLEGYREGADRGHGYGNSTLLPPSGPSPAGVYPAQFAALDRAAHAQGATRFTALPLAARRSIVEAALDAPARIATLPAVPDGANLVADFMGHYYRSEQAWDLCYRARIGREGCLGLDGSEQAPGPLPGASA